MKSKTLRVALVHDWFIGGGAEKVVDELHIIYPEAPIFTSYCTPEWRERLNHKVITGPLQAWPFSKLRKFIPLFRIWWFSSLKFDNFDLVISSSGAEAKGIKTSAKTIHINYCHAPTHYYWSRYEQYLKDPGFGALNWLARFGLKVLVSPLRKWDFKAAQRPDYIIANSTHIQKEIQKYYGRKSEVIHPPVDIERFNQIVSKKRHGFIIIARQTPYKKVDLAVKACTSLGLPLLVVGDGPDYKKLVQLAGATIKFTGIIEDDTELALKLSKSEGFIFPGLDDFGIAPVEALAAGTPVIAYKGGGTLDYIIPGKTGEFFNNQSVSSLKTALKNFDYKKYNSNEIKKYAQNFSKHNFRKNINEFINKVI